MVSFFLFIQYFKIYIDEYRFINEKKYICGIKNSENE